MSQHNTNPHNMQHAQANANNTEFCESQQPNSKHSLKTLYASKWGRAQICPRRAQASDGYGTGHHVQVVTDLAHRPRARESTRKRQRTLLRRGQSVGATRAWELRSFACMHGQAHNFPDELEHIDRYGHYYTTLKAALTAVTDAATRKSRQQPFTPREGVLQRSFL